jgi:small subunit ribosomal protein S1
MSAERISDDIDDLDDKALSLSETEAFDVAAADEEALDEQFFKMAESILAPGGLDMDAAELDALYSSEMDAFRAGFTPGEKIEGVISAIDSHCVFVDVHSKSDGIIDAVELFDKDGEITVAVGDSIEAFFIGMESGGIGLTVRLNTADADNSAIREAFASQIPIEAKVVAERKGGYEVRVGDERGFCPFSQIELYPPPDSSVYIGRVLTFLILEYKERNLVVSRRRFLEAEAEAAREELRKTLREGQIVEGTVSRLLHFGVFVDIGGVEGLIPMRELSWAHVRDASKVVSEGERISVRILSIDWDRNRIALSLRHTEPDPWTTVGDRFHPMTQYHGKVTRLLDFGAFVQLTPGVEGLVHISKLGAGKRLTHADEVLNEGEMIDVYVESVDLDRRRIALSLDNPQQGRTMEVESGATVTVGETIKGTVEDIKPYGIFVKLNEETTGLLHVSQIDLGGGQGSHYRAMYRKHPPESEIKVIVKEVHGHKVSLTMPDTSDEAQDYQNLLTDDSSNGLGSLGSLLDGLGLD